MPGDLTFWQTLLAGGSGGVITLAGQWLKGLQDRRTQVEALGTERALARAERREDYELSQLENLRDAVATLIRETEELRDSCDEAERRFGDASVIYEDGFPRSYSTAAADVRRVAAMVLDDAVRLGVEGYLDFSQTFVLKSLEWSQFFTEGEAMYQLIGDRVRALYGDAEAAKYHASITSPRKGEE